MHNIAFLFSDTNNSSGATRSLADVVDHLLAKHKEEVNISLVFPKAKGTAITYFRNKADNIDIIVGNYTITTYSFRKNTFAFKTLSFVKGILNFVRSTYNGYFFLRKMLQNRKIDVLYSNTSALCIGAWLTKWDHYRHIWHFREFLEEDHKLHHLFGQMHLCKIVSRYTDIVNCVSIALSDKYHSKIKTRLQVIYDDISPDYISDVDQIAEAKNTFLLIGNINQGKGHDIVIEAVHRLIQKGRDIKLIIAGKKAGSFYQECVKKIEFYKITDKVDFCGLIDDVNHLRRHARYGIVASKCEAFGRVTIEGMLSHMLMICNNTGASAELIIDKQNGLLFEKTPDSLASIMEFALDHQQKSDEIIENGYCYAKSFTLGNACESLLAEINAICK